MLKITPLKDTEKPLFEKLFESCRKELGRADDTARTINEYIIPDLLAGLLSVDILFDGETCAGFIIYRTEDIDNDRSFKERRGDVRGLYVIPPLRRRGLGRFLLYTAEMKLKESGADKAYCLPAAGSEGFFRACGYTCSGVLNEDAGCPAFEKTNLNNACKAGK